MPKVAIVDDEPFMVDMLSTFLKIKGFQVCSADSGEDGLTLVRIEKPDLLLLDLMLPDIDGFRVCAQLRATPEFAHMPILIVSARAETTAMAQAEAAGATGYMTKPVKLPMLLEEVQQLTQPKPVPVAASQPAPSTLGVPEVPETPVAPPTPNAPSPVPTTPPAPPPPPANPVPNAPDAPPVMPAPTPPPSEPTAPPAAPQPSPK